MTLNEARQIAARGYCHPANAHKVLDPDLCDAIAEEIVKGTGPACCGAVHWVRPGETCHLVTPLPAHAEPAIDVRADWNNPPGDTKAALRAHCEQLIREAGPEPADHFGFTPNPDWSRWRVCGETRRLLPAEPAADVPVEARALP